MARLPFLPPDLAWQAQQGCFFAVPGLGEKEVCAAHRFRGTSHQLSVCHRYPLQNPQEACVEELVMHQADGLGDTLPKAHAEGNMKISRLITFLAVKDGLS